MSTGKKKRCKRSESISTRIGLNFPVSHIRRSLRNGNYSDRIGATAPVYLAAVIEYLTAELLQLAGYEAHESETRQINPRHLQLAIRNDNELNTLLSDVTIAQGGVLPNVHSTLLLKPSNLESTSKQTDDPK
uniref:Histone H2A n=1 Tax=Wuchereria bancrofti TaxID=6293 RepID=A0AAF5PIR8_WUCBA